MIYDIYIYPHILPIYDIGKRKKHTDLKTSAFRAVGAPLAEIRALLMKIHEDS